jgi:glycine hydroxymethyltransferase
MGTEQMVQVADLIARAVTETDGSPEHAVAREVRAEIGELLASYPAYPES